MEIIFPGWHLLRSSYVRRERKEQILRHSLLNRDLRRSVSLATSNLRVNRQRRDAGEFLQLTAGLPAYLSRQYGQRCRGCRLRSPLDETSQNTLCPTSQLRLSSIPACLLLRDWIKSWRLRHTLGHIVIDKGRLELTLGASKIE